jgi:membrane-bound serine protease (ClpP class)
MKTLRNFWILAGLLAVAFFAAPAFSRARAQTDSPLILILKADGVVAPAMSEYIQRGIETAEQRSAELLVIQLNTPGGSISTMTDIVEKMRASRVPIAVYVSPRGAMAGSAGTLITLAGHVSAMAPETIIGAASPIDSSGQDLGETAKAKEMEAMTALVRTIAARRSPEAIELAQKTITEAKAVSASEAQKIGLVDFISSDLDELLQQLNGFKIETVDGPRTLNTANARTEPLPMSFIEQLLDILVNPNIVFLLVTIGVQAILIELSSPGGWVAGFIGAVCLALAAYGLGVLPVNWFGVVFLVIAFALFILDIKAPTHGALTAAGVGTFIIGALVLFNSPGVPQFQRVSTPLVVGTGLAVGLSFALLVGIALRAQKSPIMMGSETFAGKHGIARTDINPFGQVQAEGELWSAELAPGSDPIQKGEAVSVEKVAGVKLIVRKKS